MSVWVYAFSSLLECLILSAISAGEGFVSGRAHQLVLTIMFPDCSGFLHGGRNLLWVYHTRRKGRRIHAKRWRGLPARSRAAFVFGLRQRLYAAKSVARANPKFPFNVSLMHIHKPRRLVFLPARRLHAAGRTVLALGHGRGDCAVLCEMVTVGGVGAPGKCNKKNAPTGEVVTCPSRHRCSVGRH